MAEATCAACDHTWATERSADEMTDPPRCPECDGTAVDVRGEGGWYMVWR